MRSAMGSNHAEGDFQKGEVRQKEGGNFLKWQRPRERDTDNTWSQREREKRGDASGQAQRGDETLFAKNKIKEQISHQITRVD
jgi:hypothetical protein